MSNLTFMELRQANLLRCARWHPNGGVNAWSLSDWAVATAGELGEAMNVIKKLNRERDNLTSNTLTVSELEAALAHELADTQIYLDLLAARAGVALGQATRIKFNQKSIEVGFPERL